MIFKILVNSYVNQIIFDNLEQFDAKFKSDLVNPCIADQSLDFLESVVEETKTQCGTDAELDSLFNAVKLAANAAQKEQAIEVLLNKIKEKLKAKLQEEVARINGDPQDLRKVTSFGDSSGGSGADPTSPTTRTPPGTPPATPPIVSNEKLITDLLNAIPTPNKLAVQAELIKTLSFVHSYSDEYHIVSRLRDNHANQISQIKHALDKKEEITEEILTDLKLIAASTEIIPHKINEINKKQNDVNVAEQARAADKYNKLVIEAFNQLVARCKNIAAKNSDKKITLVYHDSAQYQDLQLRPMTAQEVYEKLQSFSSINKVEESERSAATDATNSNEINDRVKDSLATIEGCLNFIVENYIANKRALNGDTIERFQDAHDAIEIVRAALPHLVADKQREIIDQLKNAIRKYNEYLSQVTREYKDRVGVDNSTQLETNNVNAAADSAVANPSSNRARGVTAPAVVESPSASKASQQYGNPFTGTVDLTNRGAVPPKTNNAAYNPIPSLGDGATRTSASAGTLPAPTKTASTRPNRKPPTTTTTTTNTTTSSSTAPANGADIYDIPFGTSTGVVASTSATATTSSAYGRSPLPKSKGGAANVSTSTTTTSTTTTTLASNVAKQPGAATLDRKTGNLLRDLLDQNAESLAEQQRLARIVKQVAEEFPQLELYRGSDTRKLEKNGQTFLLDDSALAIILRYIQLVDSSKNLVIEDLAIKGENVQLKLTEALTNESKEITVIPYNRGGHFVLFICDPTHKTVLHINPKGNPLDNDLTKLITSKGYTLIDPQNNFQGDLDDVNCGPLICAYLDKYLENNSQQVAVNQLPTPVNAREFAIDVLSFVYAEVQTQKGNNNDDDDNSDNEFAHDSDADDDDKPAVTPVARRSNTTTTAATATSSTTLTTTTSRTASTTPVGSPAKPKPTVTRTAAVSTENPNIVAIASINRVNKMATDRVVAELMNPGIVPATVIGSSIPMLHPAHGLAVLEEWQREGSFNQVNACTALLHGSAPLAKISEAKFYEGLLKVIQTHADVMTLLIEIKNFCGRNTGELSTNTLEYLSIISGDNGAPQQYPQSIATIKKAMLARCFVNLPISFLRKHLETIRLSTFVSISRPASTTASLTTSATTTVATTPVLTVAASSVASDEELAARELKVHAIKWLNNNPNLEYAKLIKQIADIKADIANNRAHAETTTKKIITNAAAGVVFVTGAAISAAAAVPGSLLFGPLGPGFGAAVLGGTILATVATKKTVAWKYDAVAEKFNKWRLKKAEARMQTQVANRIVDLLRDSTINNEASIGQKYSNNQLACALLETLQTSSGTTSNANPRLVAQCLLVGQQRVQQELNNPITQLPAKRDEKNSSAICYQLFQAVNAPDASIESVKELYEVNKANLTVSINQGFDYIFQNESNLNHAAQLKALRNWCVAHSPKALIEELLLLQSRNNPKAVAQNLDYFIEHPSSAATRSIIDFMNSFLASTLPDKSVFLQQVFHSMQPENFHQLMKEMRDNNSASHKNIETISLQAKVDHFLLEFNKNPALPVAIENTLHIRRPAIPAQEIGYSLNYLLSDFCYQNNPSGNAAKVVLKMLEELNLTDTQIKEIYRHLNAETISKLFVIFDKKLQSNKTTSESKEHIQKLQSSIIQNLEPAKLQQVLLQLFKEDGNNSKVFVKRCESLIPHIDETDMVKLACALINGSDKADKNTMSALMTLLKTFVDFNKKRGMADLSLELYLQVMKSEDVIVPDKIAFHNACSEILELRVLVNLNEKYSSKEVQQVFMSFCCLVDPNNFDSLVLSADALTDKFKRLSTLPSPFNIDVDNLFTRLIESAQPGFFDAPNKYSQQTSILIRAYIKYLKKTNKQLTAEGANKILVYMVKNQVADPTIYSDLIGILIPIHTNSLRVNFLQLFKQSSKQFILWLQAVFVEIHNPILRIQQNRLVEEATKLISALLNAELPRNKKNELDLDSDLVKMFTAVINAYENAAIALNQPLQIFALYKAIMTARDSTTNDEQNSIKANMLTAARKTNVLAPFIDFDLPEMESENNKKNKRYQKQMVEYLKVICPRNSNQNTDTQQISALFNHLCDNTVVPHQGFPINAEQLFDRMMFVLTNESDAHTLKIQQAVINAFINLQANSNTAKIECVNLIVKMLTGKMSDKQKVAVIAQIIAGYENYQPQNRNVAASGMTEIPLSTDRNDLSHAINTHNDLNARQKALFAQAFSNNQGNPVLLSNHRNSLFAHPGSSQPAAGNNVIASNYASLTTVQRPTAGAASGNGYVDARRSPQMRDALARGAAAAMKHEPEDVRKGIVPPYGNLDEVSRFGRFRVEATGPATTTTTTSATSSGATNVDNLDSARTEAGDATNELPRIQF